MSVADYLLNSTGLETKSILSLITKKYLLTNFAPKYLDQCARALPGWAAGEGVHAGAGRGAWDLLTLRKGKQNYMTHSLGRTGRKNIS